MLPILSISSKSCVLQEEHDLYLLYTREIIELGTHCNPTPRPRNIDEL